jgi:hypothetical protein
LLLERQVPFLFLFKIYKFNSFELYKLNEWNENEVVQLCLTKTFTELTKVNISYACDACL